MRISCHAFQDPHEPRKDFVGSLALEQISPILKS